MTLEELRQKSLEQYAALRRKALFEAQQNSPLVVTPNAADACTGGSSTSSPILEDLLLLEDGGNILQEDGGNILL